jgi:isochorismate synthase EntC
MRSLVSRTLKSEKGLKLKAMRGLAPHEDKTCFFDSNKARYVLIGASPETLRNRMK